MYKWWDNGFNHLNSVNIYTSTFEKYYSCSFFQRKKNAWSILFYWNDVLVYNCLSKLKIMKAQNQNSQNLYCQQTKITIKYAEIPLTLFRMAYSGTAHGWGKEGRGKKVPSLKFVTHILHWWNLTQLYLT